MKGLIGYLRERRIAKEACRLELEETRRVLEAAEAEQKRQRDYLYRLGNDFEDHVASMFDPSLFERIHRTPRDDETGGAYAEGMELPDLRFKEISTGRTFWVECKFRAHAGESWDVEWCGYRQLLAYRRVRERTGDPVLVFLGLGGSVRRPDAVYCLDLDDLQYTTMHYAYYRTHRIYWPPRNLDQLLYIAHG